MIVDIIKAYFGETPLQIVNGSVLLFSFVDLDVFEHHVDVLLKISLLAVTLIYTCFKTYNEYKNATTHKNGDESQN